MKIPKYKKGDFLKVVPTNEFDDLGRKLNDYLLEQISRGFYPSEQVQAIYSDGDKFLYSFSSFSFYEENISVSFIPPISNRSPEISEIIRELDSIEMSYKNKINKLQNEIEDLKNAKESSELSHIRELNRKLVQKLAFYKYGPRVIGDQNHNDCSGMYLKWGIQAYEGISAYESYCREFNQIPIFIRPEASSQDEEQERLNKIRSLEYEIEKLKINEVFSEK